MVDHFGINVNAFDLIVGYRADDSYFDYAESFVNNGVSVEQLAMAMRLGKLGEQIVLKSKFAFSHLHYEGFENAEKINTIFCGKPETKKQISCILRCWKRKATDCTSRIL